VRTSLSWVFGMASSSRALPPPPTESRVPDRSAAGVLITASEGEALFVTLLALGVFPGGSLTGPREGRHRVLLDWMEISVKPGAEGVGDGLLYHDPQSHVTIRVLADALFKDVDPTDDPAVLGDPDDVLIGTLDTVEGMTPFTLGFVAAAPEMVARITKWKQASSICAPGPSQRAALWALGVRP
jgi:hypothetical protein